MGWPASGPTPSTRRSGSESWRPCSTDGRGTSRPFSPTSRCWPESGNAYSDEALHAARLSPYKPAGKLTAAEVAALHAGLVGVLGDAMKRSTGLPAKGLKAEKRSGLSVHGRTGEPCPVCGDTIREVSFATKSLQYCPTCQTGGKASG